MKEIELKFQVPPGQREAVRRFVAGRGDGAQRTHLQAAYVETADRALAAARMALRLRREGGQWVQTLKGAGDDGLSRDEHNHPLPDAGEALPVIDVRRHAQTAVGRRLLALLAQAPQAAAGEASAASTAAAASSTAPGRADPPGPAPTHADRLSVVYSSDIHRLSRRLRAPLGTVELAFDEGWLIAGDQRLPVCELEIELVSGHPAAVLDVARRWALRLGLWLDTRSKAERGDLLSRGLLVAAPRRADSVQLKRRQRPVDALKAVIASVRDQVIVNASQVADGRHDPAHVHQLRVGLRRLRTAWRLFDGDAEADALGAPLAEAAAVLFRRLGAARDAAVMDGPLAQALGDALRATGADGSLPLPSRPPGADAATAIVRDRGSQALLLDLIEVGVAPPATAAPAATAPPTPTPAPAVADAPRLRELLSRRLRAWHRAVLRDAAQFAALDDPARHRLRKRIKRLRYAAEFASSLWDTVDMRRGLKPLREVQSRLGELNDVAVAIEAFNAVKDRDPRAWFALGWLAARREALLSETPAALSGLRRARRVWRIDRK